MKYFISILLTIIAAATNARETIPVIYPWGMGDPMANYSRTLLDVANRQQDRYQFVLENRPGAGGALAARHVQNNPNSILAASTAFFVRPNFYPETSHDISRFRPLMTQCSVPMIITSNRYRSWNDIPKNSRVVIGVSGLGATTHLIALQIKQKFPFIDVVPYKSTQESTLDLAGNRIDLNVGFPGELSGWLAQGRMYGLGVTGKQPIMNIPTMQSLGYKDMESMSNGHSLIISRDVPDERYQEWRRILYQASKDPTVMASYMADHCDKMDLNEARTIQWFDTQRDFWRQQSAKVKLP